MRKGTVTDKPRSLPPLSVPSPAQETQNAEFTSEEVLKTEDGALKESVISAPRVDEAVEAAATEEVEMRNSREAQPSVVGDTGKGEEQKEEARDEVIKAPLHLIKAFLKALAGKDFSSALRLCQFILIYEPGHPKASEFLPLIRQNLLEDQEEEDDDDSDDDDDDDDSGNDSSSSGSSSSTSDDDDDEDDDDDGTNDMSPHISS